MEANKKTSFLTFSNILFIGSLIFLLISIIRFVEFRNSDLYSLINESKSEDLLDHYISTEEEHYMIIEDTDSITIIFSNSETVTNPEDLYNYKITSTINEFTRGDNTVIGNENSLTFISTKIGDTTYQYTSVGGFSCENVNEYPLKSYCPYLWEEYFKLGTEYIHKYNNIIKKEALY